MKSYPSAFHRRPTSKPGDAFGGVKNIKDVVNGLKSIGMSALRKSITGDTTSLSDIGEPLDFTREANVQGLTTVSALNISTNLSTVFSHINPRHNLETTNISNIGSVKAAEHNGFTVDANNNTYNYIEYNDPFKFGSVAIASLNNYNFMFKTAITQVLNKQELNGYTYNYTVADLVSFGAAPSLFNSKSTIYINGISHNVPLRINGTVDNTDISNLPTNFPINEDGTPNKNQTVNEVKEYNTKDLATAPSLDDDCSIKTLVKLSRPQMTETGSSMSASPLGWATFKYADFMFCKDVGKISNNHLIVLRKFPVPIGDNITKISGLYSKKTQNAVAAGQGSDKTQIRETDKNDYESTGACCGKLITWFGTEENRLEDICKYEYKATFREANSEIEQKESTEDQPSPMASIVNLMSGNYRSQVAAGYTGGNNSILGWVAGKVNSNLPFSIMSNHGPYTNHEILSNYDKKHVYEPQDTVQDNHIYEGKLQFTHSFTLVFNYKLRAYDNINPRAAMTDLIGNILEVTYKHGHYWGGSRKLIGPQQNVAGWKRANAILNKSWDLAGSAFHSLLNGNFGDVIESATSALSSLISSAQEGIETCANAIMNGNFGDLLANNKMIKGIANLGKGMLQNGLGRPQMYAWQSILDGSPVGFWHVTIGNPRKPILTMGNLILENTTVQHLGPLGIDDFPTEIKVTCQLKHAKSRDATDISKMYTSGQMSIYVPLSVNSQNYIRNFDSEAPEFASLAGM